MSSVRISRHARGSVADHGGSVVLNLRTGRWHALNAPAQRLWAELRRTGDFDEAVSSIAVGYPAEWRPRIREDAEAVLAALSDRRLVLLGSKVESAHADADVEPERPVAVVVATGAEEAEHRIRAHVGLLLALLLLKLPFRWTTWTVALTRRRCRTEATVPEAIGILLAVDAAARRYPGRAACLERSLAAVLTNALCRRRVDWGMGVAEDPYRFHAWLETRGAAVLSAPEPDFHTFRRAFAMNTRRNARRSPEDQPDHRRPVVPKNQQDQHEHDDPPGLARISQGDGRQLAAVNTELEFRLHDSPVEVRDS